MSEWVSKQWKDNKVSFLSFFFTLMATIISIILSFTYLNKLEIKVEKTSNMIQILPFFGVIGIAVERIVNIMFMKEDYKKLRNARGRAKIRNKMLNRINLSASSSTEIKDVLQQVQESANAASDQGEIDSALAQKPVDSDIESITEAEGKRNPKFILFAFMIGIIFASLGFRILDQVAPCKSCAADAIANVVYRCIDILFTGMVLSGGSSFIDKIILALSPD